MRDSTALKGRAPANSLWASLSTNHRQVRSPSLEILTVQRSLRHRSYVHRDLDTWHQVRGRPRVPCNEFTSSASMTILGDPERSQCRRASGDKCDRDARHTGIAWRWCSLLLASAEELNEFAEEKDHAFTSPPGLLGCQSTAGVHRPARRRTTCSESDQWSGMARRGRPELHGRGGGSHRDTAITEPAPRAGVDGDGWS